MKAIDYSSLIGKKFEKILVISKDEELSIVKKRQYYKCLCDCGNKVSMRADDLYKNRVKSCGCHREPQFLDIMNKQFNKLTALEYKYTVKKKAYWLCECECGELVIISQSHLQSGHTKSCGCIRIGESSDSLLKHFRNILKPIIIKLLEESEYKCSLTGKVGHLEVHHKISFQNLCMETLTVLNLPLYDNISKYTKKDIESMDKVFLRLHENDILIVLEKSVHINFHKQYGYKNNTKEQFDEFINSIHYS